MHPACEIGRYVDGVELAILRGAQRTLDDEHLRSVMVELEGSRDDMVRDALAYMSERGFSVASSHRTTRNLDNLSTNYLFART